MLISQSIKGAKLKGLFLSQLQLKENLLFFGESLSFASFSREFPNDWSFNI